MDARFRLDGKIKTGQPHLESAVGSVKLASDHSLSKYEEEWAGYIGVDKFNALGFDGYGEYLAVFDTGIDRNSPAIRENYWHGITTIPTDRYLCKGDVFKDSYFHGTAVCGAAIMTMPQVRIISCKCYNQQPKAANDVGWWIEAIKMLHRWQDKHAVYGVVCNMSLGITIRGTIDQQTQLQIGLLHKIIQESTTNYGNFWVAAAGNEGREGSPPNYPASFDEVYAIGAARMVRTREPLGEYQPKKDYYIPAVSDFSNINDYVDYVCLGEDFWTFLANSAYEQFCEDFLVSNPYGAKVKSVQYKHKLQWCAEVDGTSFGSPAFAAMLIGYVQQYKKEHDGAIPTRADLHQIIGNRQTAITVKNKTYRIPWLYKDNDTAIKRLVKSS